MCLVYIVVLEGVGGHEAREERHQWQQSGDHTDLMEAGQIVDGHRLLLGQQRLILLIIQILGLLFAANRCAGL